MAYFCHASNDTLLEPINSPLLKGFKNKSRESSEYEDFSSAKLIGTPKTAYEHLQMRLARIHQK
jgi:hypothetical protein